MSKFAFVALVLIAIVTVSFLSILPVHTQDNLVASVVDAAQDAAYTDNVQINKMAVANNDRIENCDLSAQQNIINYAGKLEAEGTNLTVGQFLDQGMARYACIRSK